MKSRKTGSTRLQKGGRKNGAKRPGTNGDLPVIEIPEDEQQEIEELNERIRDEVPASGFQGQRYDSHVLPHTLLAP